MMDCSQTPRRLNPSTKPSEKEQGNISESKNKSERKTQILQKKAKEDELTTCTVSDNPVITKTKLSRSEDKHIYPERNCEAKQIEDNDAKLYPMECNTEKIFVHEDAYKMCVDENVEKLEKPSVYKDVDKTRAIEDVCKTSVDIDSDKACADKNVNETYVDRVIDKTCINKTYIIKISAQMEKNSVYEDVNKMSEYEDIYNISVDNDGDKTCTDKNVIKMCVDDIIDKICIYKNIDKTCGNDINEKIEETSVYEDVNKMTSNEDVYETSIANDGDKMCTNTDINKTCDEIGAQIEKTSVYEDVNKMSAYEDIYKTCTDEMVIKMCVDEVIDKMCINKICEDEIGEKIEKTSVYEDVNKMCVNEDVYKTSADNNGDKTCADKTVNKMHLDEVIDKTYINKVDTSIKSQTSVDYIGKICADNNVKKICVDDVSDQHYFSHQTNNDSRSPISTIIEIVKDEIFIDSYIKNEDHKYCANMTHRNIETDEEETFTYQDDDQTSVHEEDEKTFVDDNSEEDCVVNCSYSKMTGNHDVEQTSVHKDVQLAALNKSQKRKNESFGPSSKRIKISEHGQQEIAFESKDDHAHKEKESEMELVLGTVNDDDKVEDSSTSQILRSVLRYNKNSVKKKVTFMETSINENIKKSPFHKDVDQETYRNHKPKRCRKNNPVLESMTMKLGSSETTPKQDATGVKKKLSPEDYFLNLNSPLFVREDPVELVNEVANAEKLVNNKPSQKMKKKKKRRHRDEEEMFLPELDCTGHEPMGSGILTHKISQYAKRAAKSYCKSLSRHSYRFLSDVCTEHLTSVLKHAHNYATRCGREMLTTGDFEEGLKHYGFDKLFDAKSINVVDNFEEPVSLLNIFQVK